MNEKLVERIENYCVKRLIELEAMKATNYEGMQLGEALAYSEEQILNLL